VLVDTLASFGVGAYRKREYPGVWTDQGKIGALGFKVKRWVTMHGVSLNVSPDMAHFSLIVPCGITEHGVTSMSEVLGRRVDTAEVKPVLRRAFERVFAARLSDSTKEELAL
jgi:lipoate-protein ligase B